MATGRRPCAESILSTPGWREGLVLDVRPASAFAVRHLRGAVSHPLAHTKDLAGDLPSIFLPPRERPLLVVAATGTVAEEVAAHVRSRGRERVDAVVLDEDVLAAVPPEMVAAGVADGHLWEPPDWLRRHADLLPPPALGPVVDLGCGSGRAAVWLATRGHRVTGLDHQPEALDLGRRLAAAAGCSCDFRLADLRNATNWPTGPWALVVATRFLQRDLLAAMTRRILPGGVVVVRTFREAPGYDGHPRPVHRLAPGELLGCFPRPGFTVLAHAEDFDPDGRPAAGIVARYL